MDLAARLIADPDAGSNRSEVYRITGQAAGGRLVSWTLDVRWTKPERSLRGILENVANLCFGHRCSALDQLSGS